MPVSAQLVYSNDLSLVLQLFKDLQAQKSLKEISIFRSQTQTMSGLSLWTRCLRCWP